MILIAAVIVSIPLWGIGIELMNLNKNQRRSNETLHKRDVSKGSRKM